MQNKKHLTIIIAIGCIILFGFLYYFLKPKEEIIIANDKEASYNTHSAPLTTVVASSIPEDNKTIIAYISGEVNKPDVYELENGSRIKDLVLKAGGFTQDADQNNINLSKKLSDEEHVHIYKIGDMANVVIESENNVNNQSKLININTATKQELMTLPSIGDVTSNSIISYRETVGKFNTIEDIKSVSRIGDKTFEKIKDLITVN